MFESISQLEEGQYFKYNLVQKTFKKHRYFSVFDWVSETTYKELSA